MVVAERGFDYKGQLSKARNILASHGLANATDLTILQQLEAKYPKRKEKFPANPLHVTAGPFENVALSLKTALSKPRTHVAPGPDSWQKEHCAILAMPFENAEVRPIAMSSVWRRISTKGIFDMVKENSRNGCTQSRLALLFRAGHTSS